MAHFDLTKAAIIKGFEHLLKKKSFSKISVKDITEETGISRNTFYYHFQDKYELMSRVFYSDVTEKVPEFDGAEQFSQTFMYLCRMMKEKKTFYYPCLQYEGQNSLFSVLTDYLCELWDMNVRKIYYDAGIILTDSDTAVYARMIAHALVGMIHDWVDSGMGSSIMRDLDKTDMLIDQTMKMFSRETEAYSGMTKIRSGEGEKNADDSSEPVDAVVCRVKRGEECFRKCAGD